MITLLVVNELLFNKILYKVLFRLVIGKRSQISCQSRWGSDDLGQSLGVYLIFDVLGVS